MTAQQLCFFCKRGHPMTADNIKLGRCGEHQCKTCLRLHLRAVREWQAPKISAGRSGREPMSDRVKWEDTWPGFEVGYVDGQRAYRVLVVGESGPGQYPVWVGRFGTTIGAGCTNVERAKDLAEMNETMPMHVLMGHGLALPA